MDYILPLIQLRGKEHPFPLLSSLWIKRIFEVFTSDSQSFPHMILGFMSEKSTDPDLLLKAYYVLRTFQVLLLRLLGTLHGCRHFMNKETKVQRTDAAFPRIPHKQAIEAQHEPGFI